MSTVWQEGNYKIVEYRYNNNKEWKPVSMLKPNSIAGFHCYVKAEYAKSWGMSVTTNPKPFETLEDAIQTAVSHFERFGPDGADKKLKMVFSSPLRINDLSECRKGDPIWTTHCGWVKVLGVSKDPRVIYPIITGDASYTKDGFEFDTDKAPSAFTNVPRSFFPWAGHRDE